MTLPAPAPEVETRDVYLGLCCNTDRPLKKWGDIVEVRDASEVLGAGKLLYSGALTASLAVSSGITPAFAIGELDISED